MKTDGYKVKLSTLWTKFSPTTGKSPVLCGYLCTWLLRDRRRANTGAAQSVILKSVFSMQCHLYNKMYLFFCFFLHGTNFHLLTDQLQFNQMSLIPPLPSILVNQSTQEMIMTHCLSNKIAPDASDITCLSVYDYTFYCLICICTPISFTYQAKTRKSSLYMSRNLRG